ncbi:MAG: galactosyltransferase-related protein [Nannocystaceae bacterium]
MTDARPVLSVIVPWCDRAEIVRTLDANAEIFERHDVEVVVVQCAGDAGWLAEALGRLGRPVTWVDVPADGFNKALALNLGVHAARGDNLLFLDCDVILRDDFLPQALERLQHDRFVTVRRVFESAASSVPADAPRALGALANAVGLETADGHTVWIETNRVRFDDGSRSGPGLIFVRREHFEAVDGMNSDLVGWGWEDLDLVARLQLAGIASRQELGEVVHLSHGNAARAGDSTHATEADNFSVCLANYRLGYHRGTYQDDVQTCADAIEIHRPR